MSGLSRSVRCIIHNDTDFDLVGTLDGGRLNWDLLHGSMDGNQGEPPHPLTPHSYGGFTTSTAGLFTGTEGWVVYEIQGQHIVVTISWNAPFMGTNSYSLSVNRMKSATREVATVPVSYTDRKGNPLSQAEAQKADDVIVTYTVRLKPEAVAQETTPTPPPVERMPAVAATANAETHKKDELPAWAKNLTPARKKMLATLHKIMPQSTVKGWLGDYGDDQPAILSTWWDGTGDGTSCVGCQPEVMKAFYAGGSDPNSEHWSFKTFPSKEWTDKKGATHGPEPGHPKWRGVEDHAPPEMPGPGDTFLLWVNYAVGDLPAGIRHVGNIVYAPSTPDDPDDCWVTACGGQKKTGVHCQLIPRAGVFGPAWREKTLFPKTIHFRGGAEAVNATAPSDAEKKAYAEWLERQKNPKPRSPWETPLEKSPLTKNLPHLFGWVSTDDLTGFDATYDEADLKSIVKRVDLVRAYWLARRKV